ncbi:histidine--tRNA ligase [Jannaschia sp. LMIT008]|uniref:histidine--tRNA ligase n=1 Tax=Jannaschia maritima TaxID=3032585 RepID=UPI002810C5AE|nr:histidine--tRNA ligase [Jannaschia sp. LMIT008]
MAKKDKVRRPRADTPRGFRDYFGADVTARAAMLGKIAAVYHRYGFDALETSAVETVEALGSFLPDVDRPNAGVFAWQEGGEGEEAKPGDWLALRYDMTAPLARVYAQHRNDLPTPYRRYAMGPVWRNEKPGPGRFRQFYQCDADTVGTASVAADAEMAAMLCDVLEAVGIDRGDYVVRINNRKVLNGVMENAGLVENEEAWGVVLRAIDKVDRLGKHGIKELFGSGRTDESGDFTKGANLSRDQTTTIIKFVETNEQVASVLRNIEETKEWDDVVSEANGTDLGRTYETANGVRLRLNSRGHASKRNWATLQYLQAIAEDSSDAAEGVTELRMMADLLAAQGYGPDRIVIDPSVVRGLGYYTGPVVEAELTFEITDDKGRPQRFGSVAGGGRYDDLVTRFTGQAVPATGISIGVDRLLAALRLKEAERARAAGATATRLDGPVVVTVMDRDRMADYQSICAALRDAGIRAEVYLGNPKNFGNQLKYADRRNSPAAIIQGSDEAARSVVQVKDLALGAKIAEGASLDEWKSHEAQKTVTIRDPKTGKADFTKLIDTIWAITER